MVILYHTQKKSSTALPEKGIEWSYYLNTQLYFLIDQLLFLEGF